MKLEIVPITQKEANAKEAEKYAQEERENRSSMAASDPDYASDCAEYGYIAGAEKEAERAEGLVDCLKKVRKYFPDTTAHAQDIDKALNKYNNPSK